MIRGWVGGVLGVRGTLQSSAGELFRWRGSASWEFWGVWSGLASPNALWILCLVDQAIKWGFELALTEISPR